MTSVLISGASIAGPALASWLHRYGFEVTVIERAAELRSGGQNVDVRGAGREVARRMGLEDAIRAATTGEAGVRFVDADDRTIASFAAGTSDSDGPTAELEILRGDLARLLVEQTASDVEYVFGDHITDLDDDGTTRAGQVRARRSTILRPGRRGRRHPLQHPRPGAGRRAGGDSRSACTPRT